LSEQELTKLRRDAALLQTKLMTEAAEKGRKLPKGTALNFDDDADAPYNVSDDSSVDGSTGAVAHRLKSLEHKVSAVLISLKCIGMCSTVVVSIWGDCLTPGIDKKTSPVQSV
jgi:hypothetical protein